MNNITDELSTEIRTLAQQDKSEREIAALLGCSLYRVKLALGRPTGNELKAERRDAQDAPAEHQPPIVEGVTPEQAARPENIWAFAIEAQRVVFDKQARKQRQSITLPDEPVAIAFLSDLHIGSAGTDYAAIRDDARLVRDTPGMYAVFHGDGMDNWVVSKLTQLQRGQALGFDAERLLFEDWMSMIAPKLIAWVEGNHDLWTEKLVGVNPNRKYLDDARMLWDRNQCVFSLEHCSHTRTVMVRHKWRYNSIYNPTHGLQVGWERGDFNYDLAIGGHTHVGTLCHSFYRHNRIRHAILTGTYKTIDSFGEELGMPAPKGRGCGALVLTTDGQQIFLDSLELAAKFLAFLRGQQ